MPQLLVRRTGGWDRVSVDTKPDRDVAGPHRLGKDFRAFPEVCCVIRLGFLMRSLQLLNGIETAEGQKWRL